LALCAANGTNYVDITGEAKWVRRMIELYDDLAKSTGAKIVNCCGCDSIPWDIMTFKLSQKLKEGEKLVKVSHLDEL